MSTTLSADQVSTLLEALTKISMNQSSAPSIKSTTIPKLLTPLSKHNWHFDKRNLASLLFTHDASWWDDTDDKPTDNCPLVALTQNLSEHLRKTISACTSSSTAWAALQEECAGNDTQSRRTALLEVMRHKFTGDIKSAFVEHDRLISQLESAWGTSIDTKALGEFLSTLNLEQMYPVDTKIHLLQPKVSFSDLRKSILSNPNPVKNPSGGANKIVPGTCTHGYSPPAKFPNHYCFKCKPCDLCTAAKLARTYHVPKGKHCHFSNNQSNPLPKTGDANMTVQSVIDSGAFRTISPNKEVMECYSDDPISISVANGQNVNAPGIGKIPFWNKLGQPASLESVYAPHLTSTLLSVSQFDLKGYASIFTRGQYFLVAHELLTPLHKDFQQHALLTPLHKEFQQHALLTGYLDKDNLYKTDLPIRSSPSDGEEHKRNDSAMAVARVAFDKDKSESESGREINSGVIPTEQSVPTFSDKFLSNAALLGKPSPISRSFLDMHRRLGHVSLQTLKNTIPITDGLSLSDDLDSVQCADCKQANSKQKSHPSARSSPLASKPGELIHCDFYIMSTPTIHNQNLAVEFIDDYSREVFVYLLSTRTAESTYKCFLDMIQQLADRNPTISSESRIVQKFRSDNDKAFGGVFGEYLKSKHIRHQLSAPYNHPQNGVAERMNLSLGDMERAFRVYAELPLKLWGYAYEHSAYIKNRLYTSANISSNEPILTPSEKAGQNRPDLSTLPIWGCAAVVHIHKEQRTKGSPHGRKCRYLGESQFHGKGTGIFIECSSNRIIYSSDVDHFNDWKTNPTCATGFEINLPESYSSDNDNYTPGDNEDTSADDPNSFGLLFTEFDDQATTLSDSESGSSEYFDPTEDYIPVDTLAPKDINGDVSTSAIIGDPEGPRQTRSAHAVLPTTGLPCLTLEPPQRYRDIKGRPDEDAWYQACDKEINGIMAHHFGKLVPRPPKAKVLQTRFTFKIKADNSPKARWCAKDIRKPGTPAIYSPVATDDSFKLLMATVCQEDMECEVVDVKQAFLKAFLDADEPEIYVTQPEGYVVEGKETWVYKLTRSLYGLQCAPKVWYKEIDSFLTSLGFHKSDADNCLYYMVQNGVRMLILIHVDDLCIASKSSQQLQEFKRLIHDKYGIKDLGPINRYLMYQVFRNRRTKSLVLHQHDYIKELLETSNMASCHGSKSKVNIIKTGFLESDLPTDPKEKERLSKFPYKSLTGSLQQLATHTRPDILYEVQTLSKYNNLYGQKHIDALKQLLKYLKHTSNLGLTYQSSTNNFHITGWADSSYNSDKSTGRSCGG